jgi:DNA polymerase-3 subunit delta
MELAYGETPPPELTQPLHRAYLFWGSDTRLLAEAEEHLRRACVGESDEMMNCAVVHASDSRVEDILANAAQVPFGSEKRLVVVRGAEHLRRKERASELEMLAKTVPRLGELTCLVLLVMEEANSRSKTALSAKADAAFKEHGCFVRLRAPSREELASWAQIEARKCGKNLEPRAAVRLVEMSLGERRLLEQELEKLICFAGTDPAITLSQVEQVATSNPQDVMFRLVDAVANRNAEQALRYFREALRFEPRPHAVAGKLIALLRMQIRQLWQAGELRAMGIAPAGLAALPSQIAAQLPSEHSLLGVAWKARDLFAASRRWSRAELARAMELLQECDLASKGAGEGSDDVVANVDLLLIRLCT